MTYTEASETVRTQLTSIRANVQKFFSDNAATFDRIEKFAYNTAVFIGVCFYLVSLALQAALNAGKAARALWIKYEMAAKFDAAIAAVRTEIKALPKLSIRIAQVKVFYGTIAAKLMTQRDRMAADYRDIAAQFTTHDK